MIKECLKSIVEQFEKKSVEYNLPILTEIVLYSDGSGRVVLRKNDDISEVTTFSFYGVEELAQWLKSVPRSVQKTYR